MLSVLAVALAMVSLVVAFGIASSMLVARWIGHCQSWRDQEDYALGIVLCAIFVAIALLLLILARMLAMAG